MIKVLLVTYLPESPDAYNGTPSHQNMYFNKQQQIGDVLWAEIHPNTSNRIHKVLSKNGGVYILAEERKCFEVLDD